MIMSLIRGMLFSLAFSKLDPVVETHTVKEPPLAICANRRLAESRQTTCNSVQTTINAVIFYIAAPIVAGLGALGPIY